MSNIKINSTPSRVQYTASAGQTEFSVPFPFNTNADIAVYKRAVNTTANDAGDRLQIVTDYTVSGAGAATGGSISLIIPATLNDVVTIGGVDLIDRDTIIYDSSRISAETLNTQFNNLVIYQKQLETKLDQLVLQFPYSESNLTTHVQLPKLGPDQIWKRNHAGTGYITSTLPDSPIGSLDGSFDDLNRLVRSASSNEVEETNLIYSGSGTLTTASGNLNISPVGSLALKGIFFPSSGSVGQVLTLTSSTNAAWQDAGGGGTPTNISLPTITDAVTKFSDTAGAMVSAKLQVVDASLPNVDVITTSNNNLRLLPGGTGVLEGKAVPTTNLGLATKGYVDGLANGVNFEAMVRVATTANLAATYANGTAGVGATLTNSGVQAALTIDGVAVSLNDRVLVKNQSTGTQNGIYVVSVVGSGATNWVLTRATDFDSDADINRGDVVPVLEGTTYNNLTTGWMQTNNVANIGTDPIAFTQWVYSPNQFVATVTSTDNAVALYNGTGGQIKNSTFVASGNNLVLPADPTIALAAATKQYVDNLSTDPHRLVTTITQTAHGFSVGQWLYLNGATYALANASTLASAEDVGVVIEVVNANVFVLQIAGIANIFTGLISGAIYFQSSTTPGAITTTPPSAVGEVIKPLLTARSATEGYILNYRGNEIAASSGGGGATGSYVKISTATAANSALISFTGLSNTYKTYVVIIDNVLSAAGNTTLSVNCSTNNGVSYDAGSNYIYTGCGTYTTGQLNRITTPNTAFPVLGIQTAGSLGLDTVLPASGQLQIFNPSATAYINLYAVCSQGFPTTNALFSETGGYYNVSTGAVNAIQFSMSSGNIAAGNFTLYGII